ncbi:unnamed protein product, partial [Ectocarpus sp. 12 AP-2014]
MKFRHYPSTINGSGEWNTGFATPTIKLHVLMCRKRLANTNGLVVQENHEYVDAGAAAAAGAAAEESEEEKEEEEEEEEEKMRRGFKLPPFTNDCHTVQARPQRDCLHGARDGGFGL